jgi:hypothetical protein
MGLRPSRAAAITRLAALLDDLRRIREVADQHAVEAGPLVDARRLGNHVGVDQRSGRRDGLR